MKNFFITFFISIFLYETTNANEENSYYTNYLKKCGNAEVKFYNLEEEVYIFQSSNLNLGCLEKEFQNHLDNFPVISWVSNDNVVPGAIIRNSKTISEDIDYSNITIASLYSQKCGEQCEFSDEAIIVYQDNYWYLRGLNDRGIQGFLLNNEILHIQNYNSTHTRNYIFNIKDKKFTSLPNGELTFNKDHILVTGQKSYFTEMGAFWFDNKINFNGEIIELISNGNTCKSIESFNDSIKSALKNQNLNEFCVTTY